MPLFGAIDGVIEKIDVLWIDIFLGDFEIGIYVRLRLTPDPKPIPAPGVGNLNLAMRALKSFSSSSYFFLSVSFLTKTSLLSSLSSCSVSFASLMNRSGLYLLPDLSYYRSLCEFSTSLSFSIDYWSIPYILSIVNASSVGEIINLSRREGRVLLIKT